MQNTKLSVLAVSNSAAVRLDYTNWQGTRRWRVVRPIELWFGESPHHPWEQLFLRAIDLDKNELRDFAVQGIHAVEPVSTVRESLLPRLDHRA